MDFEWDSAIHRNRKINKNVSKIADLDFFSTKIIKDSLLNYLSLMIFDKLGVHSDLEVNHETFGYGVTPTSDNNRWGLWENNGLKHYACQSTCIRENIILAFPLKSYCLL